MTQSPTTKLLAIVHKRQRIPLEELLTYCPELTWNQVFSLVDDLSRHALIGLVPTMNYERFHNSIGGGLAH